MKHLKFYLLIMALFVVATVVISAETVAKNPLEWLAGLEVEVFGQAATGSLKERLNNLDELVTGRIREETLVERLSRLDKLLYINQPHDISLIYKIQALEWVLFKEASTGSLRDRVERLEKLLVGEVSAGPITKRLERLILQIFPNGSVKGRWVTVPDGLIIKVKLVEELSSIKNKPEDRIHFIVAETVYEGNLVLFPKGVAGVGVLQQVKKPANMGRDARLMLDFSEVRAMDGTMVEIFYGAKAQEINSSRQWAVGASAAGMAAFGPQGILFGLAVKGREKVIPAGTELYLQVKEPVRIYTIER